MGRSLLIVGAGLAGIISAKCALSDFAGHFTSVRILDKASTMAGLWRTGGFTHDNLHTNLSKFTCAFSDSPWHSSAPEFVSSSQVREYLVAYAEKHGLLSHMQLSCEVEKCTTTAESAWEVQWRDATTNEVHCEHAECLLLATGIFSVPFTPPIPGMDTFSGAILHSSEYRRPEQVEGSRVLVVGGSLSGLELAVELVASNRFDSVTLLLSHDHLYVLPKKIPVDGASVPADLFLFARQATGNAPTSTASDAHDRLRQCCSRLLGAVRDPASPPWLALTDADPSTVDRLAVRHGWVTGMAPREVLLTALDGSNSSIAADAVIFATGYRANLDFLDAQTQQCLRYDPSDPLRPILGWQGTIPFDKEYQQKLAVVALQKAPYFGTAELQARLALGVLTGQLAVPADLSAQLHANLEGRKLPAATRPQMAHRYPESMRDLGQAVFGPTAPPIPTATPYEAALRRHGPLLPFLYSPVRAAPQVRAIDDAARRLGCAWPLRLLSTLEAMGPLRFRRTLSGTGEVSGDACFTPASADAGCTELRFQEEGSLRMLDGKCFPVRQKYVWRLSADRRHVEVCFDEDPVRVMHRLALSLVPPTPPETSPALEGRDVHLCSADTYVGHYRLWLEPPRLEVVYVVSGPNKDYTASTTFVPVDAP